MPSLPRGFYLRSDVVKISRELLGKVLYTRLPGPAGRRQLTGGVIVETEAYAGPEDRASHAFGNRRTARTEVMFHRGGIAYVYLCYGIHSLLNVVTHSEGIPHAILIRAIEPTRGRPTMLRRRHMEGPVVPRLTAGPGALSQAMGIDPSLSGETLDGPRLWIEDQGIEVLPEAIVASPRVGVAYAGLHAARPWRFRVKDSPWTSPAK